MGRGSDTYPPALLWLPLIYGGARRQNVRSGNIRHFLTLPMESYTVSKSPRIHGKVTPEKRQHMIAEAAYFRAAHRGFHGGCPLQDWLEAEREITRRYFQQVPSPREALVFL